LRGLAPTCWIRRISHSSGKIWHGGSNGTNRVRIPPSAPFFTVEIAFLDGGSAAPFYFFSSAPGITPFNGFANSFCNSGCGSGFLGSIWSRIAAL